MKKKIALPRSRRAVSADSTAPAAAGAEETDSAARKRKVAAPKTPRKTARKAALKIPPILLEDELPPTAAVSGPGQKFTLGPVPPVESLQAGGGLPEAYGTKRLLLAARDPHWLYAHWDLSRDQQRRYNTLSADKHLVVRVYADSLAGKPAAEVHVHPESRHWFIHVDRAGIKYIAELGYYSGSSKWTAISMSDATLTPPDTVSSDTSAEFATIPIELPFSKLLSLVKAAVQSNAPLAKALEDLRASGWPGLPKILPHGRWTPAQEQALAKIISMDTVRRVWMGSLEITELICRQLLKGVSSVSAAQLGLPSSISVSSLSSPFGGEQAQKGFWFNVNAELIVYGATEPDATVTIGGRKIRLRADGSFSYRFALPDGQYELPIAAVSADKTDGRAAELKFSRGSDYSGEVGTHPQDPNLKAPLSENL